MSPDSHNLNMDRSAAALAKAIAVMPGGVSSPVRAYGSVGGTPPFIASGSGSHIRDVDGNRFIDYVMSWGPLILGHAHETVLAEIGKALKAGTSFGAPTERETKLAHRVVEAVAHVEQVRFVNSGTEATMSALRLARAATKRPGIVKFEGAYHGHVDAMLVAAGSGAATHGTPSSPGVLAEAVAHTHVAPYNDLDAVREIFANHPHEIAAVIVEPVAGNMGVVPPARGFLDGLRKVTAAHDALLIFDEVMTGFRLAHGGAAELYGVEPDLATYGKVIGGGLPVGAYGGRRYLMQHVSPVGPVYQAGTLSGNPLAMAAGLATLDELADPGVYLELEQRSAALEAGLAEAIEEAGALARVQRVGSMLSLFFTAEPVTDYAGASGADARAFGRFFRGMLDRGIYLPPSPFETWFVSLAHTEDDISRTIEAARLVLGA